MGFWNYEETKEFKFETILLSLQRITFVNAYFYSILPNLLLIIKALTSQWLEK